MATHSLQTLKTKMQGVRPEYLKILTNTLPHIQIKRQIETQNYRQTDVKKHLGYVAYNML